MPRLPMLAVLLLPGCTAAEITSSFADLRWHVSEMFNFAGPPPAPPYPGYMVSEAASPSAAGATAAAEEK
jgi:hypothetical protein